jgi:hypothetical protein
MAMGGQVTECVGAQTLSSRRVRDKAFRGHLRDDRALCAMIEHIAGFH